MRSSTVPSVPRGWRSLLTGRWHRSSWVVATLVLLFLALCNLPGQFVTTFGLSDVFPPQSGLFSWFGIIEESIRFEHGWPLAFLVRPNDHSRVFDTPTVWDCWAPWMNGPQFRGWALAINSVVVLALAAVGGAGFEAWRRLRQSVWQLHLRDIMVVTIGISLVGAWYVAQRHRYQREQAVLAPEHRQFDGRYVVEESPPDRIYARTLGGITWIRLLAGEQTLEFLDPVAFVIVGPQGLPGIANLKEVSLVYVDGRAANTELRHLASLPRLEVLQLEWHGLGRDRTRPFDAVELPAMPRLVSLTISGTSTRCEGFEQLTSLRVLDLSRSYVDDEMLRDIARMPRLRHLNLSGRDLPPGGLVPLSSLRSLEELIIDGRQLDMATMTEIGQLTSLKRLSLRSAQLPCDGLGRLIPLERLEMLYLDESDLRSDRARSANWWPDLISGAAWKMRLGPEAAGDLRQMTQLRVLSLGKAALPQKEIDALKAALPQCEVHARVN